MGCCLWVLWVCLASILGMGNVLAFDNFSVLWSKLVLEVLLELGVRLLFLPVYYLILILWSLCEGV
jgi:hypothetical protein